MRAHRRSFLLGLLLAPLGCRRALTRDEALRATLARVLMPDARAIAETSQQLEAAMLQLVAAGDAASLERARQAFAPALLAWERSFAFQHGPFMTSGALLRACYWPARRNNVANLVLSGETLDASRIALLGVDQKGLFNLEQLLFERETEQDGLPWVLGAHGPAARALARAFASDVKDQAQHALAQLGDGRAFADEFARDGQMSVNRLFDKLLGTVEATTMRIERVFLAQADHKLRLSDVQAGPSGLSSKLLETWLTVVERCYGRANEPSLAALVQAVAPAIHAHASAALAKALGAVAALGPLEQVARSDASQLSAAMAALRALEVSIRSELASALGVSISFNSHDGD